MILLLSGSRAARPLASTAFAGFALAVAVAAAAAPPEAPKKPARPDTWYAATVARDEKGAFLMVHFWSHGPRMRAEAVIAGRRLVTIVNGKNYIMIDAVARNGVSIERSEHAIAQDATRGRPFGNEYERLLADGGERVGSEKVGDQTYDVFRITDGKGRRTVWVTRGERPVPLRVETFDRQSGTTGRIEYLNWLYGIEISDAFFEPPGDVKLTHFTYDEYRRRTARGEITGPAPVLYRHLLHGSEEE